MPRCRRKVPGPSLERLFLDHAGDAGAAVAASGDLEERLRGAYEAGRAANPGIELAAEDLVRHLAEKVQGEDDPAEAFARVRAEDLYLACACARGDQRAIADFERRFLVEADVAVARLGEGRAFVDEVKQVLRERLFVAEGGETAKIADYGGRGPLGAWVRVAAVRTALTLRKLHHRFTAQGDDALMDVASPVPDPELQYLRSQYLASFQAAFRDAFLQLSSRQRNVLRLHFLDSLSIDEIGAVYAVHRATAARWIAAAREQLYDATREFLRSRMQVSTSELDSVMRLVQSQLDLSIHEFLRQSRG